MAIRPIGYGSAMQKLISGTPPHVPPNSMAQLTRSRAIGLRTHTTLEEQNRIRTSNNPMELTLNPAGRPNRAATVVRGRISVPARGTGRIFMFNPNDITDTKGISWGSVEVPGASHPVYQFGAGGERLVSFDLYVDGDRGRFGREQARDTSSLSIRDELHWYRSLEYPTAYGGGYVRVAPFECTFTFGTLYQNMACIVKKADWKVNYWVPDPKQGGRPIPVRAIITMQIAETVSESVTADKVLFEGELNSYEF